MPSKLRLMTIAIILMVSAAAGLGSWLPAYAQSGAQEKPEASGAGKDVRQQVAKAVAVVEQMKGDPQMPALLKQAQGVFIVPTYAHGGLGVAVRGGEGVMLARQGAAWSPPLFYNVGGVSIGLQAGAEVGPVVMLLMNEKAVKEFQKENNIALNADAGLTLVNYNANALAGAGQGDVVVWTNTKGAFANAAVGVVDIHFDDSDTRAYHGKPVKPAEILGGKVKDAKPGVLARVLQTDKAGQGGGS